MGNLVDGRAHPALLFQLKLESVKERHDRILVVLTRHVYAQVGLPCPNTAGDPQKWTPEAGLVIEGDSSRVTVDINVTTDITVVA